MTTEHIFTTDWFSHNIPLWENVLARYKDQPHVKALEIGSYQGRSTVWLLENILSHSTASITCIDTFQGSIEHTVDEKKDIFEIFTHNIAKHRDKVTIKIGKSQDVLKELKDYGVYDVIYIDGDHKASSVLEDAILALPLLKKGGMMIFDDYAWEAMPRVIDRPQIAINAFVSIYADEVKVIHRGYQLVVQKLV